MTTSETTQLDLEGPGKYGPKVRWLRTGARLSGRELCSRVGITPSYLSDIENGRRLPAPEVSDRIADAVGADRDALWRLATLERLSAREISVLRLTFQDTVGLTERAMADALKVIDTTRTVEDNAPLVLAALGRDTVGDELGVAWKEAEAALPEGWALSVLRAGFYPKSHFVSFWAVAYVNERRWYMGEVSGPTPAAALQALTAALNRRQDDPR